MPRTIRKLSSTGIYHVISRGNDKKNIFLNNSDYYKFLQLIKKAKIKHKFFLYAFCLMRNHFHLLLKTMDEDPGKCMHSLLTNYAIFFKNKYSTTGHLFQNRFKSEPVEDDKYFCTVFRYIHQNPVKAKIVSSVKDYPWSSFHDYAVKNINTDTEFAIDLMDGKKKLLDFISFYQESNQFLLGEEKTDENMIKKISSIIDIDAFKQLETKEQNRYLLEIKSTTGLCSRDLANILDLSYSTINRALRRYKTIE